MPKADGAGYTAETVNLLDGARNKWFRPSDVCVAPDGSLMVADWYDPGVGGHRMGDVEHGRVFRLAPHAAAAKYAAPKVDVSTAAGAIAALKSANMSARYMGWTALHAMGDKATAELVQLLKSDDPILRARALGVLVKQHADKDTIVAYLTAGLQDESADVRCATLRLARQLGGVIEVADLEAAIDIEDPSPAVRRELLIGLRELFWSSRDDKLVAGWVALANQHDGADRWYLEALGVAAEGQWDRCLPAYLESMGRNWMGNKAARDIVWRSRAETTPQLLAAMITSPATPEAEVPRALRALDFQRSGQKDAALMLLAFGAVPGDERASFVHAESLTRLGGFDINANPAQKAALLATLDTQKGTEQYIRLVDKFSVAERYGDLLALAQAEPESQLAIEAVKALLGKREQKLLVSALTSDDAATADATIRALATSGDGRAVPLLTSVLNSEEAPINERRAAVKGLGSIRQGAVELQQMADKGTCPESLLETLKATLHTVQWRDIKEYAATKFPLPPGKDAAPLPSIAELASRGGDATHGSVLFHSTATCATCHQVGTLGKNVGPNLSEIGKKLAKEAMYESILYPSAAISHNFENWLVVDDDGNQYSGLLVSETDDAVEIKDPKGLVRSVPRGKIEVMKKQEVSLMPADLQKLLTASELVDIVEYMTTLKEAPKP
ncbi:MAG: c-type cytochrome [Planctomycetaceae bacterium]